MIAALGLHLVQWVSAFLVLDRFFQTIPLEPQGLRGQLRHYRHRFLCWAVIATLVVGAGQVWLARAWGALPAMLGWMPWWLLWRFGWRKQLTHLYRHDGGVDLVPQAKPDR